jgi:hypothetical protein
MVTNIHIGLDGRLGNQLFQYAALKSLCIQNKYDCVLPNIDNREWHGQKSLLKYLNVDCTFSDNFDILEYQYEEDSISEYDENFYNIVDNTTIRGFFQNLKYFERHKDIVVEELTPKKEIQLKAKIILDEYKRKYEGYEFVSVHIRRGDNVTINHDTGRFLYGSSDVLDEQSEWGKYFISSKKQFIDRKVKYIIFTGGSRENNDANDHNWVDKNFIGDEYIKIFTGDVLLDYTLISQCDHNILSHASSFGWWAAYINKNPKKLMIAPKNYFLDNQNSVRLINKDFISI